jgi:hypothetical protein
MAAIACIQTATRRDRMDILRKVWHTWKRMGQFIGDLIARVVLTIFYFTVFLPFGLGVRLWGDPLAINSSQRVEWCEPTPRELSLDDARRLS